MDQAGRPCGAGICHSLVSIAGRRYFATFTSAPKKSMPDGGTLSSDLMKSCNNVLGPSQQLSGSQALGPLTERHDFGPDAILENHTYRVCGKVVLPVEEYSLNGEFCLNCLCQPRGQAQLRACPFPSVLVSMVFGRFLGVAGRRESMRRPQSHARHGADHKSRRISRGISIFGSR